MSREDELRAELAVLDLERQLREAKDSGSAEQLQEAKYALRAAREEHRTLRSAAPLDVAAGDAVARPDPVKAKAGVKSPGGK